MQTYTLISTPYYNTQTQNYINAITINVFPQGALGKYVQRRNFPLLSPFTANYNTNTNMCSQKCNLVIVHPECGDNYIMTPDDIPYLFSFLTSNGYHVETRMTEMVTSNPVKINNGEILCMITYYPPGHTQPNITYMR